FLFHDLIQKYLFTLPTLLIALFIPPIYIIIPHNYSKTLHHPQTLHQINYFQPFLIPISQPIPMSPPFTTSPSTISTPLLIKFNHKAASHFTFIISLPIILPPTPLSLLKHYHYIHLPH
ncbi:undecaprenyl-diphosphate phosphatase, partial [Staphylococcus epidermidis]|uniref:undecaprenyl-diphosphate phosphatase n=1 Tax=Staphylococcus epidermidis TaxID=1282 RepID=UPI0028CB8608